MSSIAALLQAAEYIERREREVEHGYASSLPGPFILESESYTQTRDLKQGLTTVVQSEINGAPSNYNPSNRRLKTNNRKPQGNRSTHNELEKNRRAHLRNCLEKLKDIVPVGGDSSRHTTLGLLNKAKHFIKALEDKERKAHAHRENLLREQRYLRRRLELLSTQVDAIHKRRSVSECSTSTVSSSHSSNSESDEHEVDVIGYGGASDDDHSSIRSGTSDGGVTVTTWRQLTIGEDAWKTAKDWTKIIKVLLLNQPFSQSLTLKKNFLIWILLWTIIFPRRNKKPRKFACDEKKTLSISVQLCLVRCEKIQNRDSPESKKKSGHSPLKKKVQVWLFLRER